MTLTTSPRRRPFAVLGLLVAAGCSTGAGPLSSTSAPTTTAPVGTPIEVDMCSLMPLGDVQANSPFTIALSRSQTNTVSGSCAYSSAIGADEPVGMLLTLTAFQSAADAMTSHRNHEQAEVNLGIPPTQISGLGDTASSAGQDEVGVQAVLGNLIIDANLKGQWPDVADASKVAAGTALIQLILSRLP